MPMARDRFSQLVARARANKPPAYSLDEVLIASAQAAQVAVLRQRITAGAPQTHVSGFRKQMWKPVPDEAEDVTEERQGAQFEIALVLPEGLESGDGRSFAKGALSRRELPLPLMWQVQSSDGHDGSVVVGRIDELDRTESGMGNARGYFDTGPYGVEAQRLVENKMLRFVSADLDKFEADAVVPDELSEDGDMPEDGHISADRMIVTRGRVMGVTLVAKPAFQECTIKIVDENGQVAEDVPDGVYEGTDAVIASAATLCAAVPVQPPKSWFSNPDLDRPTAITVDDSGHVYGHIASWDMDHIGMPFGTRVPASRSKYAYFHTGVIRTEEGDDVPVGQLTLSGGHAPLSANAAAAMKHYDDTKSAIADVRAGEDSYGVWVSGALRPDVSPEQVRSFRASSPSGDWRQIKGALELVAVCQVNVPGFPVTRAQVASGAVLSLVAAGAQQLARMQNAPSSQESRLRRLEEAENMRASARVLELRERLKPSYAAIEARDQARLASVRDRVIPLITARHESERAAFAAKAQEQRDRLNQALGVTDYVKSFKELTPQRREQLVKSGFALKDGSYPIENEAQLKLAIQACGPMSDNKTRRHVTKRARALNLGELIPDTWAEANMSTMDLFLAGVKDNA